ncbi:MAG: fused MFS/spermidine synthase [Myxococcota bacterium]
MRARSFGLLLLCFFLSGLAALIYQTAWTRQFAFVFGTSELAVASVLAAYMGGLALGAAVAGRLVPRIRRPILVYGLLELAIGLTALAVPWGLSAATRLYVAVFGSQGAPADEGGLLSALFYLACSFAILLIPTSLMGATLPLLARHAVRREEDIGRRIAHLYATNTAGAVVGTVLTAFVLLPAFGLATTVWLAVGVNLAVFAAAAVLARVSPPVADSAWTPANADPRDPNRWVLPLIAISGAVSFTYEVLWTRLLGHVLGGSVYAFATMLATFLLGIAIGSWLASGRLVSDRRTAATAFAWAQVGAGLLSLVAYLGIDSTPGWVQSTALRNELRLLLDAGISAAILLPGTLCIGATFPLAVRVLARSQDEASQASARVYSWNTVGAITGAVGAGFFLIPAIGFAWTLAIAVATNAGLAVAAGLRTRPRPRLAMVGAALVLAALVITQPGPPWQVLRMGGIASRVKQAKVAYYGVGRSATVLLQHSSEGWQLSSNGLAEAQITRPGVRIGRYVMVQWMSNLPAWGRPDAKSILIVGFGGGLIVAAVHPNFEKIDVIELESKMITANELIADERLKDPLADPRVELIINDARSALLLTQERYDAIASQPSHPWTAAAAHLYTREFFQLVRDHLADDGVFVQWMGLSFIDEMLFKTLIATLHDVFPHVRVYRPSRGGVLFTASPTPFEPEREAGAVLAAAPELAAKLGVRDGADIVAHMLLDDDTSRAFARGAPINTDDRNILQMRSPAIVRGKNRFNPKDVIGPFDPLAVSALDWDRSYLIRRLLATGLDDRARRISDAATNPVERHVGQGFLARRKGDRGKAMQHFRAALELDANNAEARIAILELFRSTGVAEAALAERLRQELTPLEEKLVSGWLLEREKKWDELRELENDFRSVLPQHPAFPAAARLRAAWRLGEASKNRAEQAMAILDEVLPLTDSLNDLVARAEASGLAGYPTGASSTIWELIRRADSRPRGEIRPTLRRAIVMLSKLPPSALLPGIRKGLTTKLRQKLR